MLLYYRGASFNLKLSKLVNSPLKQGIAGEVWIQIYDNGKKKISGEIQHCNSGNSTEGRAKVHHPGKQNHCSKVIPLR